LILDNRELAILIWAVVALVGVLSIGRIRPSVVQLLRTVVHPKLLILWVSMLIYIGLLVWLLALVHVWTTDLISETVFWFFGPAVILLSRFEKAKSDPLFLRRALRSILEFTLLAEFVINLYPLNLAAELVLIPVVTFLALTATVAALKPEYQSARKLLDVLLALIGFGFLIYAVVQIIRSPESFVTLSNLRELLLPILLTLGFVPFVYGVAVAATYGELFGRLNWKLDANKALARYAKWRLLRATRFRLKSIRRFNLYPWRLTSSMDRAAVGRVIARFKAGDTGPGM
jgi:hypothetical protein